MRKNLLFFTLYFISSLLYSQNITKLEDDVIISKHFNKNDFESLNKVLIFFDKIVMKFNDKNTSIDICYQNYCRQFFSNPKTRKKDYGFSFPEARSMLNDLNNDTFNKIWYYTKVFQSNNGKMSESSVSLGLAYDSPYMYLIKDIARENPHLQFYYDILNTKGSINSEMTSKVRLNYNRINFKEIRERFLLAVHFLTLKSIS